MNLALPPRIGASVSGSAIAASLFGKPQAVVEAGLEHHLRMGNIPDFLRTTVDVPVQGDGRSGTVRVLPDVLSVGTDENFFRVPMTPGLAQRIADISGAMLPTRKIVNAIWHAATVKLEPKPQGAPYDATMQSVERFWAHHLTIEDQLADCGARLGALVAGHKKDVVVTPHLMAGRVAIFGWHRLSGDPIQPLNFSSHDSLYRDYSHGIRLVDRTMVIDGEIASVPRLLADPVLHTLVSDEGVSRIWRQP